eukprot:jgi/Tetstr1/456705/TSEL_043405.t1
MRGDHIGRRQRISIPRDRGRQANANGFPQPNTPRPPSQAEDTTRHDTAEPPLSIQPPVIEPLATSRLTERPGVRGATVGLSEHTAARGQAGSGAACSW